MLESNAEKKRPCFFFCLFGLETILKNHFPNLPLL